MPQINVPQSQRPGITELANLSADAYASVVECVRDSGIYVDPGELIEHASKRIASHTALGPVILNAIIGLRGLVDSYSISIDEVVAGVIADAAAKNYVEMPRREVLARRLTELLVARPVTLTAKAYSLVVADAAPFSDVRIVSDVRPIFQDTEDNLEFSGSVIVHHLKIGTSGQADDFHSTLTVSDLVKLKKAVDRALEKDQRLRDVLEPSPLHALAMKNLSEPEK